MKREHFEKEHSAAEWIADLARDSLILEVYTTPKPGLVDMDNNGSHRDMDLQLFLRSARALHPYFLQCAEAGLKESAKASELLSDLRPLGIRAEQRMYAVTGGVNTHKGAVFSMGIFCAAAGLLCRPAAEKDPSSVFSDTCREICHGILGELDLPVHGRALSHGENLYRKAGITGIRGEAAAGYPTVFSYGYPIFRAYLNSGLSRTQAGACTLLHLISQTEDTNIVSRSSLKTLRRLQKKLSTFLHSASADDILLALPKIDKEFIRLNISPGGCADLLALIYFLDGMQRI